MDEVNFDTPEEENSGEENDDSESTHDWNNLEPNGHDFSDDRLLKPPKDEWRIKPVCSIAKLLLNYELYGGFDHGMSPDRNRQRPLRHVSLRSIVKNPSLMRHTFLGFTKDSRYLLSYTLEAHNSWMYPFGIGLFAEESVVTCNLHFWRFVPVFQSTREESQVVLFGSGILPTASLKISLSQWVDDDERVVIVGCWNKQSCSSRGQPERQVAVSVVPVPHSSKYPEVHTTPVTCTGSPNLSFTPNLCLVVENFVFLYCGEVLLVYRFMDGKELIQVKVDPYEITCSNGKKRKMFYDEEDHESSPHTDPSYCEPFEPDITDALMWERFDSSTNSSHLVNCSGQKIFFHDLENVFRHTGCPKFVSSDSRTCLTDLKVDVGTLRIDILMDKVWSWLKKTDKVDRDGFSKFTYSCCIDEIDVDHQEFILKAGIFAEITKRVKGTLEVIRRVYPFYIHLNYVVGDCTIWYYANGVQRACGDLTLERTRNAQLMQICGGLQTFRKKHRVYKTVHTMDNFNVGRGRSLSSLITPDGLLALTL
ncbi:hypothetical protein RvY_15814 [Ramazzottius varieornatus]|uniref:DDB1- and CUL4-associated factor 15 WD40 repeat-containing domain-containing protein n=1 Tax=Ramazzottius varieornatus TaxID=947166 RepID=A0A1D1VZB4_RAMVA|nr:hypothetical protein RvY_15814 [Ramazzottius varieornatus]